MINSLFLLSFFRYTHIYGLPDPLFVRRLPFSIPVSLSDAFIARTIHCLRELQLMIAQAERKGKTSPCYKIDFYFYLRKGFYAIIKIKNARNKR